MGAIDYWCNLYTPEAIQRCWWEQPEIAEVVRWWHMEERVQGRSTTELLAAMDASDVDVVLIPSAKMASYKTQALIWDVSEEEVAAVAAEAPTRIAGLVGIDPRTGMDGVRRLEEWVRTGTFVGAHLHTYGFGLPINDRRYYPFYAKCVELGVPVVMQVGHSAERMPSHLAQPILLDDIALDLPELIVVGAHTGWPWLTEMVAMAWKHRNVYIGTSAHHPRYWDPELVSFANSRGRGKVLLGTDYPVLDFDETIGAIEALPLRPEARELLLGGAARAIFRLPNQ